MTTSSGIFLSNATIASLPASVRDVLLSTVFGLPLAPVAEDGTPSTHSDDPGELDDDNFVELSPGQAKAFLEGCGPKTRAALEVIANNPTRFVRLAEIGQALGVNAQGLPGVWTGLTKRTRTITGNSEAYLIHWSGEGIHNDDGVYVDQQGEVRELTYRSLRKALGIT